MSIKTVEKLEVHVTELNVKIEELNRTIIDITNHKTRISQENIELTKEVQDLKVCDRSPTLYRTLEMFLSKSSPCVICTLSSREPFAFSAQRPAVPLFPLFEHLALESKTTSFSSIPRATFDPFATGASI